MLTWEAMAMVSKQHPKKFEVAINKNVARSLGIPPHEEMDIKNKMLSILRKNK